MVELIIFSIIGLSAMILPLWLNSCSHEWEVIDTHESSGTEKYISGKRIDFHTVTYVQKCNICGKLNHYTVHK